MGQYQQWLHHQEIEQQLRSRLELLESELAQLQAQSLEGIAPPSHENVIIQALLSYVTTEPVVADVSPSQVLTPVPKPVSTYEPATEPIPATTLPVEVSSTPVSPALLAWSRLPNLDAQKIPILALNTNRGETVSASEEEGLLPQDMTTFFTQHPYPVSPPKLPPWLENAIAAPNNPVDQQTLRTNRLVERWLKRWRKTSPSSEEQREDEKNESHRG